MLIKNGTIHIGNGEILHNGDIYIKDGIIDTIGSQISVSPAEEVIDATGKEVFPGFIDPVNYLGCIDMAYHVNDMNEKSEPITPHVNIKHSFDPDEMTYQELFKSGITSVGTSPGNTNVIGGQMAVMKTFGKNVNKMLVKEQVSLKGSVIDVVKETFGSRNVCPKTRMGVINLLKEAFAKASKYEITGTNFIEDAKNEMIKKVLNKEIPFFVTADTKVEIDALIEALKEYDINLVICNAYEAHKSMPSIRKSHTSIVIGELSNLGVEVIHDTDLNEIVKLHKEGTLIGISLMTDSNVHGRETYLWTVSKICKTGLDSEEILKMMTSNAAKMLGVYDKIGSLEKGKDGDVVIYTKNPIKYCDSYVTHTIIRGNTVFTDIPVGKTNAKEVKSCC